MPELPEVTVISEDVAALAVGREVLRAAVFRPDVTNLEPEEFGRRLVGRKLRGTGRRGKIIVLDFGEVVGIVHLVISGRVLRLPGWREPDRTNKAGVKGLLLDQSVVAGLGNIYVDEILFAAGVHPSRKATPLTAEEMRNIPSATRDILRRAIGLRGTTFDSYHDAF